jgi:2-polyprenyl-6-hydroxyphenyl methylase/3-demethylubiquinone-9 3-methyltransferase
MRVWERVIFLFFSSSPIFTTFQMLFVACRRAFGSSVNAAEVAKFSSVSALWWDEGGPFRPLHQINKLRCSLLRTWLTDSQPERLLSAVPLAGLSFLDVGCGGGLASLSIARMGGKVLGIDPSPEGIQEAQRNAGSSGLSHPENLDFRVATVENLVAEGNVHFDVVCALEVIEHVNDQPLFLKDCARLVKPGGDLLVSSINSTREATFKAKFLAEHVLQWVPKGTHDPALFISPEKVKIIIKIDITRNFINFFLFFEY